MAGPQLDLFGEAQPSLEELLPTGFEPPPADFVQRIRGELEATLALALAHAMLAGLRAAFEAEMVRLYGAEDEMAGRDG
jgi:hypothetical protein